MKEHLDAALLTVNPPENVAGEQGKASDEKEKTPQAQIEKTSIRKTAWRDIT